LPVIVPTLTNTEYAQAFKKITYYNFGG